MKATFTLLILLISAHSYAQKVTTLTCIDRADSNFQFNVSFDPISKAAFFGDKVYKNSVTNELISYTDVINGSAYQTHIYRDTGRFTVFVSGSSNFNFGGVCNLKTSNKF